MFKDIADEIIKNRRFDVNALDADCNTVLMVAMGFPQIAENCGNGEFYNHLVRKSFEAAEVVN